MKFTLTGNVIDPDGQDVTLTLVICDGQTTNFDRQNLAWEIQVSIANCIQNDVQSPYTVDVKATDESGDTTTLTIQVVDPNAGAVDNSGDEDTDDDGDDESSGISPCTRSYRHTTHWFSGCRMGFPTPRLTNSIKHSVSSGWS